MVDRGSAERAPGYRARRRAGEWAFGGAVLVLLAAALLPASGWLARRQIALIFHTSPGYIALARDLGVTDLPGIDLKRAQGAWGGSGYEAQLLEAMDRKVSAPANSAEAAAQEMARIDGIRALAKRFPDQRTAVLAHCLRLATLRLVHPNTDPEVEAFMTGKPASLPTHRPASPPAAVAAFLQDAEEGERLEPGNAYFPLMRAVGLVAARKDADALGAIEDAAHRTRFEDDSLDEAAARIHEFERHERRAGVEAREAMLAMVLSPHLAALRQAARFTAYRAARAELAGDRARGMAIRHAMMRCGALLRAKSRSSIGSRVGMAIVSIEMNRAGGAPPMTGAALKAWTALTDGERAKRRLGGYCAYLQAMGLSDEEAWVKREMAASEICKAILEKGPYPPGSDEDARKGLFASWLRSMTILANLLGMLALCGSVLLLRALRRDRGGLPILVALVLFALACLTAWHAQWQPVMGVLHLFISQDDPNGLAGPGEPPVADADSLFASPIAGRIIIAILSVSVPALMILGLLFVRSLRPRSVPLVFTGGLATVGGLVCLALALIYAANLGVTVAKESAESRMLSRLMQNECTFCADVQGKPWPGLQ